MSVLWISESSSIPEEQTGKEANVKGSFREPYTGNDSPMAAS